MAAACSVLDTGSTVAALAAHAEYLLDLLAQLLYGGTGCPSAQSVHAAWSMCNGNSDVLHDHANSVRQWICKGRLL